MNMEVTTKPPSIAIFDAFSSAITMLQKNSIKLQVARQFLFAVENMKDPELRKAMKETEEYKRQQGVKSRYSRYNTEQPRIALEAYLDVNPEASAVRVRFPDRFLQHKRKQLNCTVHELEVHLGQEVALVAATSDPIQFIFYESLPHKNYIGNGSLVGALILCTNMDDAVLVRTMLASIDLDAKLRSPCSLSPV